MYSSSNHFPPIRYSTQTGEAATPLQEKVGGTVQPITLVFIILGLIGACSAATGGALMGLTNLDQIISISLIGGGGASAISFLILATIGEVKRRKLASSRSFSTNQIALERHPLIPQLRSALAVIDTSYPRQDNKGILDLVYYNICLGFACVVDGAGHSNPQMQGPLKAHFDQFIAGYTANFPKSGNLQEIEEYFQAQMESLHRQFRDESNKFNQIKVCPPEDLNRHQSSQTNGTFLDQSYKPAMSFVQLVQSEDKLHLLTAQAADTMVVVEMPNKELLRTQNADLIGVGGNRKIRIQRYDITGASRVIGFTDGIGEFLNFEELKKIVTQTASEQLFEGLKAKIVAKEGSDSRVDSEEHALAANRCHLKKFDPTLKNNVDDMALFVLDL